MTGFSESLKHLPVLGVGASLSLGTQPDPVQLAKSPQGPDFIEYAGAVDVSVYRQEIKQLQEIKMPLLYHPSCLNLCGPWANPTPWLQQVNTHVSQVASAWLAQDVAICFVGDAPGYSIDLGYFIPPILTTETLLEAQERVLEVREHVKAPLLLEPAPVTCVVGDMNIYQWLSELAVRTDCGLLIDAGHVVSHQLAMGRDRMSLCDGLDAIAWDRVVEVHVAGGVIQKHPQHEHKSYYLDAHDLPVLDETWQIFRYILQKAPALRAVCYECENTYASTILWMLSQVRERVTAGTINPELSAYVEAGGLRGVHDH